MRVTLGAMTVALATFTGALTLEAQQLREDSYRWFVGPQVGALWFETQTQTRSMVPTVGIQMLVVGKRGGLQISVEEGFGSEETSAYADTTVIGGVSGATFDRLRKYSATLMAFPVSGQAEPFLGVGFGILHTVNTQADGVFATPEEQAAAFERAKDLGSSGFASLVGGVQIRMTPRLVLYGQYQITTAPPGGKLLVGPSHALTAGLRLGLGRAREDARAGGF